MTTPAGEGRVEPMSESELAAIRHGLGHGLLQSATPATVRGLLQTIDDLQASLRAVEEDVRLAASDLMVDMPEPGTDLARVMHANSIMRRERDAAKAEVRRLREAAETLERAEQAHANCPDCEGEGVPELCGTCFPLFDDARVKRRAALTPPAPLPHARRMERDYAAREHGIEPAPEPTCPPDHVLWRNADGCQVCGTSHGPEPTP